MSYLILVFEDRPSERIFRFLRKGFRHCYLFRHEKTGWRKLDPMNVADPTSDSIPVSALDLLAAIAAAGGTALLTFDHNRQPRTGHALRPLTCVELVKHAMGLRSSWLLTPWRLFRQVANSQPLP